MIDSAETDAMAENTRSKVKMKRGPSPAETNARFMLSLESQNQ
jgi:hypothetical protein